MGLRGVESHQVLYASASASASMEFSVSLYSHIDAFHIFPSSCKPRGPSLFQSIVMVAALSFSGCKEFSASVKFSVSFYSHIYVFHIFPSSCKPRGPSLFQSMVMVAALSFSGCKEFSTQGESMTTQKIWAYIHHLNKFQHPALRNLFQRC